MRGLPPAAITAMVFVVGFALCTVQFPNFASTRVAAGHSCPDQALSQAVMPEDLQRRISPDSRDWAAAVPRFQMTLAAFDARPVDDAVHWRPDPDELLSTPLRI